MPQVLVRTEAETGDPQTYLDASQVVEADPSWPGHGTALGGKLTRIEDEGISVLVVRAAARADDTPLPVREESESGPLLPAWNVTGLGHPWPAHGTPLDTVPLAAGKVLVIIPDTA